MPFIVEFKTGGAFSKWEPDLDRVYDTSQEAHKNCGKDEIVSLITDKKLKILIFARNLEST